MDDVAVALLAGGLATRMLPLTADVPKSLLPVAGRPFIEHQLGVLRRNGVRAVVVCLGHLGEQVERHVGDGDRFGLRVCYSHDGERLLGTGGSLRKALPLLGDVFWVLYGDSLLDFDYQAVLAYFLESRAAGLMTAYRNEDRWERSNLHFHEGRLLCYSKNAPTAQMRHVDYGASLLRREVLEPEPVEEPWDLASLYSRLVSQGQMVGYEVTHRFYEIGSPAGLAETEAYLMALPDVGGTTS
jgi:NDP-sugar pyrophosphorylase family protein